MAIKYEGMESMATKLEAVNIDLRVAKLDADEFYTNDAEEAVRKYFETLDYNVHKLRHINEENEIYLKEQFEFFENFNFAQKGIPDYFVDKIYQKYEPATNPNKSKRLMENTVNGDYRFVEVKSPTDALRVPQIKWIGSNPHFPVEIVVVQNLGKR